MIQKKGEKENLEVCGDLSFRIRGGEAKWDLGEGELFAIARWESDGFKAAIVFFHHTGIDGEAVVEKARAIDIEEAMRGRADKAIASLADEAVGFGLCLWNDQVATLYRDPIGRLPLFWSRKTGVMEWGTLPSTLEGFDGQPRRSQLRRYVYREEGMERDDFFQGINRLRAGEVMRWRRGQRDRPHFRDYWPGEIEFLDEGADTEQRLGDVLRQAVRRVGDRGARALSLSGGVDSTLLAALFVHEGYEIEAFSMVDPSSPEFHEEEQIQKNCEALGIELNTFDIGRYGRWKEPGLHREIEGFGPLFMPEMAYMVPFLNFVLEKSRGGKGQFVSGLGADQLFFLTPESYALAMSGWEYLRRVRLESSWIKLGLKRVGSLSGISHGLARGVKKRLVNDRLERSWSGDVVCRSWHRPAYMRRERMTFFKRWEWDYTMRLCERYRRLVSALYRLPFLELQVVEVALALPTRRLRAARKSKFPLRQVLAYDQRVEPSEKSGLFTAVVNEGLRILDGVWHLASQGQPLMWANWRANSARIWLGGSSDVASELIWR